MKSRFFITTMLVLVVLLGVVLPVFSFKLPVHKAITTDVLKAISKTVGSNTYHFTDKAIGEVVDANLKTDTCATCQFHSEYHFDGENFAGASQRLIDLKNQVLSDLSGSSPNGKKAREHLGQALHTLQDFYAHSTRVENGLSGFDNVLGTAQFSGLIASAQTCPTAPAVLGGAGQTSITSGYFPLTKHITPPFIDPCDTSAIPTGKCLHGNDESHSGTIATCDGINKDSPTSSSHGQQFFTTARDLAKTATQRFVEQLILNDPSITNNAKAVRALMGVSTTLGMVVDTTGSMGDVIASVQGNIAGIVNSVVGTPDEPDQYLLEPFNDPFWGPVTTTADANTYLASVNSLFAFGGGDCPELAMHGMIDAVNAADEQSTLYLFTDASAKDSGLFPTVNALAAQKKIKIKYGLFGSCSPIDPGFKATAAATGGQVFVLNRFFETGSLFPLVGSEIGTPEMTIHHSAGTLASSSQSVQFPVDSTLTHITASISLDSVLSITLTRPDGTPVSFGDPGTSITQLSTGRVFLIDSPQTGIWTLQIQGFGDYSTDVQGRTSRDLLPQTPNLADFGFVVLGGSLAHQGYVPMSGQPVLGSTQTALATVTGLASNVVFNAITEAGDLIAPLNLSPGDPNAAPTDYVGNLGLSGQPFRVVVTGIDANGTAFQRTSAALVSPQTVQVTPALAVLGLPQGKSILVNFSVTNMGPTATFTIAAIDSLHFLSIASPSSLTLNNGETGTVTLSLDVPLTAGVGDTDAITVAATNAADATVSNSTVQELDVVPGFNFDGGGQRPRDVNQFLTYANPTDSPATLPVGVSTFTMTVFYGQTTIPTTFSATLNGVDVSTFFHPQPGTFEFVPLQLQTGKNLLILSIDGSVSTGRIATDTDRLVFQVQ